MFSKLAAFFKGFFHNVAADPASSIKGVVSLAGAAGVGYLAASGAIPVPLAISLASPMTMSGVHALGTDNTSGVEAPAAIKTEAAIQSATALLPAALSVVEQINTIKAEADAGQKKIDTYQAVAAALAQIVPPSAQAQ